MWRGRGGAGVSDVSSQLRDTLTRGFWIFDYLQLEA